MNAATAAPRTESAWHGCGVHVWAYVQRYVYLYECCPSRSPKRLGRGFAINRGSSLARGDGIYYQFGGPRTWVTKSRTCILEAQRHV
jgi:hypothetical protein